MNQRNIIDQKNELAWELRNSQTEKAHQISQEMLQAASAIHYDAGCAASLRTSAYCQNLLGNHPVALLESNESLKIYQSLNDVIGLFEINNVLGQIYWELSDYPEALRTIVDMVEYARQLEDIAREADALNNLSMVYVRLDEFEKGLIELNKALALFRKKADSRGESFVLNNIAMIHHIQGNSDLALKYAFKSLEVANKVGLEVIKVKVLETLGEIYTGRQEEDKALIYLNQSLEIATVNNMKRDRHTSLAKIGRVHLKKEEPATALIYYKEALELSIETESNREIYQNHLALSEIYEQLGDHVKALEHHKFFFQVNQEVFNESSDRKLKGLEVRHRTETVKREAELLRDKNDALNKLTSELDEEVIRKTAELRTSLHNEKALKRSLAEALSKEQELNRLKSSIINTISHEFRTPLNAIIGYSEILMEETEEIFEVEDEICQDVNRIHTAGHHLLQLISNVLDLSKLESENEDVSISKFSVQGTVNSVVELIQPIMKKQRNQLTVDYRLTFSTIISDELKVRQILLNLLSNAAKFTEDGDVNLTIFEASDSQIGFSVQDSGIGILEENFEAIFESFHQIENSLSRNYGGTGLGLAISKGFAEQLSGKIEVQSELNQGSTFTLFLPICPIEEVAPAEFKTGN